MKEVVVITGGAGGMGLATAKLIGKEAFHVVLSDVNQDRLDAAVQELAQLGIASTAVCSDIADRVSVEALVDTARQLGHVRGVVHTAGVSPQMGDAAFIVRINVLGTVNIAQAFLPCVDEGFSLVNVASSAGHMLPGFMIPTGVYKLAFSDPDALQRKLTARARRGPKKLGPGVAYSLSKNFVMWYTRQLAATYGAKGGRVVSVSPGSFDTSMGQLEKKSGSDKLLDYAALKRFGKPEEVAELLAFLGSGKAAYISGTDILIDGGTKAGFGLKGFVAMVRGR